MRWVRSYVGSRDETLAAIGWAGIDPPSRSADDPPKGIVLDPEHFDPVFISGYNYHPFLAGLDDDVTLIEWDLALSREDRQRWAAHCQAAPGLVQVAPYRQYYGWCKPADAEWGYVHRQLDGPVTDGDPECDLFGFGLVYIPQWIARAIIADCEDPDIASKRGLILAAPLAAKFLSDVTFSHWHRAAVGHRVPIRWDVNPVHLHYPAG